MVEVKKTIGGNQSIVVYYVEKPESRQDERDLCEKMNSFSKALGIIVDGYREFEEAFPISPTTLKPKTRYPDGFVNYSDIGERITVSYTPTTVDDI